MYEDVEKSDLVVPEVVNIDDNNSITSKKAKAVDLRSESEKAKAWVVKALVIIFGSTIGCCFLLLIVETIFSNGNREDLHNLVTLILVAQTGTIGTILGFYFGDRTKS